MDRMERAAKRFGRPEQKPEKKAESTASGKDAPHASPKEEPKTEKMKPNDAGAQSEGAVSPYDRHVQEMEAMHKRHQQAYSDMHSIHADELKQMHSRHAQEIGNGAKASEGASLPSAKKAAGKGWKTKDKGTSGTEPKGDK